MPPLWLPGKTVKAQLISLIFFLTAIAIVVLGVVAVSGVGQTGARASSLTAKAMTERAKEFLEQAATSTAAKNSLLFKAIEQKTSSAAAATRNILENPDKFSGSGWKFDAKVTRLPTGQYGNSKEELGSVFYPSVSPVPAAIKKEFEITSYLDYIFPQVIASEPNAVALYFTGYRNTARYYPNIGLAEVTAPDFDIASQEFFTVANPQNDPEKVTKWTSVYDDPAGNGLTITAAHPIYLTSGAFAGTVAMDVTLNTIGKNIENYSPIESSYAFLIDNQGRAVALPERAYQDLLGRAPKKGEFGTDLKDVKGDFAAVLQNMRSGKDGFTSAKTGNTSLFVAYAPVEGTNFSLGIVARQATLLQVVTDLQRQVRNSSNQVLNFQVLPLGAALLLVVWLFGFYYIRFITEPINRLTAQTARVANGDFDVEPTTMPVTNEIGQLASSFNDMVDDLRASRQKIAEQNQQLLHTEQTRLEASINSLNVGFIMTGTENEVILLNDVAKQILTYDDPAAGSAKPTKPSAWTTDTVDAQLGQTIAFKDKVATAFKSGQSIQQGEVDFRGRILRVFVAPIREGVQSLGAVVLIEDITAVKALERSKDEFFSIASHELRTPLTAVRGNAALIQQLYGPKVKDKDFDEMINDIHDASVRLIEIVNDFLDASRLEQGKIQFENTAFAVQEVLDGVAYDLGAVAKEKGNTIKIGTDVRRVPAIFADKNRVKQIVYNLVGNAMKFTENGTITVDAQISDGMMKTTVTDTGPGISEDGQRLLFRKFQQVGAGLLTRDASRGTGLGLYISKLLSEQMGGRIALEHSEVGKGTTFSFTLPLAAGSEVKVAVKPVAKPVNPRKKS
jgi:signal transduction histidine kinase/HAMP domain-containing protein